MASKMPISNIILKILSEKKAFSEDDLLNQIDIRLRDKTTNKPYYGATRSVRNLLESGHVEYFDAGQTLFLRITSLGKQKLISSLLNSPSAIAHTSWDGYWRIVILDLPESRKTEREALRYLLRKAGFHCLKNSVWVTPYPFEHIVYEIKKFFDLKDEMVVFISNMLDQDTEQILRKIFRLN